MGSPMAEELPRRLSAVMFTDVVGYTALMQEDEEAARVVRLLHREALEAAIAGHGGELVQYLGDGSLSTFPSAVRAVAAGVEVQKALQDQVPLRVGVHEGEIAFDDQGIYGDSVNVAARVMALGTAGSVLVSDKVNDELKNQKNFPTTSLGRFPMKNVKHPPAIYAVSNDGLSLPTRADLFPSSDTTTRYEKPPLPRPEEHSLKGAGRSPSRLRRATVAMATTLALGGSAWGVYAAFATQRDAPPLLSLAEGADGPPSGSELALEPVAGDDVPVAEPPPVERAPDPSASDTPGEPNSQTGPLIAQNLPETAERGPSSPLGNPTDSPDPVIEAALDGDRLAEIQDEFDSYLLRPGGVPDAMAEAATSVAGLVFERNANNPALRARAAFVHAQALGYVDDWPGAVIWGQRAVDLAPGNREYQLVLEAARGNL